MMEKEFDNQAVSIERAVPADAEIMCDIRDRAWMDSYPNTEAGITIEVIRINAQGLNGEFVPPRIAYIRKQLVEEDGVHATTFVAKIEKKVVGFIDPRTDEKNRRSIGAVYVAPEVQSGGIGSMLIRKALDWYGRDQDIFLEVVGYNECAIRFYERFGFEKSDAVVPEQASRPAYMKALPQTEMVLRASE